MYAKYDISYEKRADGSIVVNTVLNTEKSRNIENLQGINREMQPICTFMKLTPAK